MNISTRTRRRSLPMALVIGALTVLSAQDGIEVDVCRTNMYRPDNR